MPIHLLDALVEIADVQIWQLVDWDERDDGFFATVSDDVDAVFLLTGQARKCFEDENGGFEGASEPAIVLVAVH